MQRAVSGDLSASEIIALLQMKPHPEGGHYVEIHSLCFSVCIFSQISGYQVSSQTG